MDAICDTQFKVWFEQEVVPSLPQAIRGVMVPVDQKLLNTRMDFLRTQGLSFDVLADVLNENIPGLGPRFSWRVAWAILEHGICLDLRPDVFVSEQLRDQRIITKFGTRRSVPPRVLAELRAWWLSELERELEREGSDD